MLVFLAPGLGDSDSLSAVFNGKISSISSSNSACSWLMVAAGRAVCGGQDYLTWKLVTSLLQASSTFSLQSGPSPSLSSSSWLATSCLLARRMSW